MSRNPLAPSFLARFCQQRVCHFLIELEQVFDTLAFGLERGLAVAQRSNSYRRTRVFEGQLSKVKCSNSAAAANDRSPPIVHGVAYRPSAVARRSFKCRDPAFALRPFVHRAAFCRPKRWSAGYSEFRCGCANVGFGEAVQQTVLFDTQCDHLTRFILYRLINFAPKFQSARRGINKIIISYIRLFPHKLCENIRLFLRKQCENAHMYLSSIYIKVEML